MVLKQSQGHLYDNPMEDSYFSRSSMNHQIIQLILQLKESRCHRLKQIMTMVFYVLGSKLQVTILHIGNANFQADPILCGMANFTLQMVCNQCLLMSPNFLLKFPKIQALYIRRQS